MSTMVEEMLDQTGGQQAVAEERQKRYEFLVGRQGGISANDLYEAMSKDDGAERVYYSKTRPITWDDVDKGSDRIDLMRGRFLEPIAVPLFWAATGRRGRREFGQVFHPMYPNAMTSPDGTIFADETRPEGQRGTGTLEIKAPRSGGFHDLVEHGTRESIIYQLQGAVAVRGHAWGSYGFLNLEHSAGPILPVDVVADPEVGDFMLTHAQEFWDKHVAKHEAPTGDKWALLLEKAPPVTEQDGTLVVVSEDEHPDVVKLIRSFMGVMDVRKQAEDAKGTLGAELDAAIGEAFPGKSKFQVPHLGKLTKVLVAGGRPTFDEAALRAHRPIDRDKFIRAAMAGVLGRSLEISESTKEIDQIADGLALDVDSFKRPGSPFAFWKSTPSK